MGHISLVATPRPLSHFPFRPELSQNKHFKPSFSETHFNVWGEDSRFHTANIWSKDWEIFPEVNFCLFSGRFWKKWSNPEKSISSWIVILKRLVKPTSVYSELKLLSMTQIPSVLKDAQSVGLMTAYHNYLITNMVSPPSQSHVSWSLSRDILLTDDG